MRGVLFPSGYVEVKTPLVFNKALWETSGHWEHYRENMFLIEHHEIGQGNPEAEQLALKAMNCPGHMLAVRQRSAQLSRSAAALPRADAAASQRSVGHAVRPDARAAAQPGRRALLRHAQEQIGEEVERLLRLVQRVYGDFGLQFESEARRRGPPSSSARSRRGTMPRRSSRRRSRHVGEPYTLNEGDGAFYGPKIDFDVTDAIGRKWQCATIQLDYQMPERFDLKYIGADNTEHRPVVIHRAIFGSFERFIAILIEHYAGAFPLWLAPVQAIVLPIADRHVAYAQTVRQRLADAGFRAQVDERQEKIGYKIREAQLQKVPYMLVVGDREAAEGAVAVRSRSGRRSRIAAARRVHRVGARGSGNKGSQPR